jgi:hypothetical protein
MRSAQATVTREVTATVMAPADIPPQVRLALRYDVSDPYAVSVDFEPGSDGGVTWVLARQLLWEGLAARAGEGDVRIWPSHGARRVRILLASPDGEATVDVPAAELAEFLRESYRVCPDGGELAHVDLDSELRALLPPR